MTTKIDTFVSVIAQLHNQAGILPQFLSEVSAVLETHYTNYEIILVDDASNDQTAECVKRLLTQFKCVRFIPLSREMGDEIAFTAGLESVIGDYVVTIHPDFDPPGEITKMVELCRAGHDIVVGITDKAKGRGLLYRSLRTLFYRVGQWLIKTPMIKGLTSFRVLSRDAVNALTRIKLRRRYFCVMASDIGYGLKLFSYEQISRSGAKVAVTLPKAVHMGLSLIIHNSSRPLRFVSILGLAGSLLSLSYAAYVVVIYVMKEDVLPGWTTMSLQSSGLFLLLFVMLTLMGEYLGRLLDESSSRPLYHVRGELTSSVMITNNTQRNVLGEALCDVGPAYTSKTNVVQVSIENG